MRHLLIAVIVVLVIVVAWVVWPTQRCINPIPLRARMSKKGGIARKGALNAADPCPPPGCADFASCSTGNITKRLQTAAARFPDIDRTKVSDALAMRLLQGCDGTDVGACADFLPYVCSCSGLSDMCKNAPDPKPDVCKQNPRTPTAAYGINCSDIRLTQGPCPCDCDGGGGGGGNCPNIAGKWTMGTYPVVITTGAPTTGGLCDVLIEISGAGTYNGFIPKDKPANIFWHFDAAMAPAVIAPDLKKITWRDQIYLKD